MNLRDNTPPFPIPQKVQKALDLDNIDKLMLYMCYYVDNFHNGDKRISFEQFCCPSNYSWVDCGENWKSRGRASRYQEIKQNLFHWYCIYNWDGGVAPKMFSETKKDYTLKYDFKTSFELPKIEQIQIDDKAYDFFYAKGVEKVRNVCSSLIIIDDNEVIGIDRPHTLKAIKGDTQSTAHYLGNVWHSNSFKRLYLIK